MRSRFGEGVALGAFLGLSAVIVLLMVYGLTGPTWAGVKADTVTGGLFTLGAAGLAVLGVGWQIEAGRRRDEARQAAELSAAKIPLIDTVIQLRNELNAAYALLLSDVPSPMAGDQFDSFEAALSRAIPVLENTARHASSRDAAVILVTTGALKNLTQVFQNLNNEANRAEALAHSAAAFALVNGHFEYAYGERPDIIIDAVQVGNSRFRNTGDVIDGLMKTGTWKASGPLPDSRSAREFIERQFGLIFAEHKASILKLTNDTGEK